MGDIVEGISRFLRNGLKNDCHIIFHYPQNHNYEKLIPCLMDSFADTPFKITYELDTSWSTVHPDRAAERFKMKTDIPTDEADEVFWFSGSYFSHRYWEFKRQWKGNLNGPILLALNHKDFNEHHPLQNKFFSVEDNNKLLSLVDNKNFFELGNHYSFENNVLLIANCSAIVGIEGGWTHVAHSMNAPFKVANNKRDPKVPYGVHSRHPCLECLDNNLIFDYLKTRKPNIPA